MQEKKRQRRNFTYLKQNVRGWQERKEKTRRELAGQWRGERTGPELSNLVAVWPGWVGKAHSTSNGIPNVGIQRCF